MTERDPLLALRGLIDEPIAPRPAFAEELRARLLTELESHRPSAISEERTMEITTPGLHLVLPGSRKRRLPNRRSVAQFAAAVLVLFGLIAVFASERAGGPSHPQPTMEANLGVHPPSLATPEPDAISDYEADNGVLWKVPTGSEKTPFVDVIANDGVAYFLEQQGYLYAVDAISGELRWKANVGQNWGMAVDESGVYVTARLPGPDTSTRLVKLDIATGQELWRISLGDDISSQPMLSHDLAYIWDGQNYLYAIDAVAGTERWSRHWDETPMPEADVNSSDQIGFYRPEALLNGDSIFAVTSDGVVGRIALENAEAGNWEWSVQLDDSGPFTRWLAVAGNTVAVVSTPNDDVTIRELIATPRAERRIGSLVVFQREGGHELWRSASDDDIAYLAANDEMYFVAVAPRSIPATPIGMGLSDTYIETRAYDANTGSIEWGVSNTFPNNVTPDGSTLLTFDSSGFTSAIDTKTGQVLGTIHPFGTLYPPYALTNEVLYAIHSDGSLIAVDLDGMKNGKLPGGAEPTGAAKETPSTPEGLLWTAPPESGEFEGSSVVFAGNVVIRAIKTSDFYGIEGLNALSGEQLWSRELEWTGAPVSDGRVVYVPANSAESSVGEVIAIDPLTGTTRWDTTFGGQVSTPNLQLDGIYVMSSNDMVTKLDPISGDKEWESVMDSSGYTPALFPDLRAPAVAANAVITISNSGTMFAFDRYTGGKIWSKSGYDATTTRYAANGDVLVITRGPDSAATPEATTGETLPMRIERIDLTTGETAWSLSALFPLPNQPIISSSYDNYRGYHVSIYVLVEQASTADGYYDENGFHPGEVQTVTSPVGQTTGTLIIIDPDSGAIESLQFDQQFAYGTLGVGSFSDLLSWPVRTPTNNGPRIDLGQPIYGPPATDNQIFLVTLQDGTLVALDASVTRLG